MWTQKNYFHWHICVCVSVCMYVYIYIYIYIYVYVYISICICIYIYIYIYKNIYICMYVYVYIYIYIYTHTCICAYMGMYMAQFSLFWWCIWRKVTTAVRESLLAQLSFLMIVFMSSALGPGSPTSFSSPTLSLAACRGTDKRNGHRKLFTTLKFFPAE